jgi:hypothetical protein
VNKVRDTLLKSGVLRNKNSIPFFALPARRLIPANRVG